MNILVTGGNGQLGRCIDKISGDYPDCNFMFADLPEANITDVDAIEGLIKGNKTDVIINCAAYTLAEKAEAEGAKDAVFANIKGPSVLADTAARNGCALVHISTDYVFGGKLSRPLKETDKPDPLSVYGVTKLAGEAMVLSSCANAAVIRTSWLYSEFGSNFMKTMLRLSATRDEITVVNDQMGCPTYGIDLARAIMMLVLRGISGRELYHYSNLGEVTWCGFAKEIFRQTGQTTEVIPISSAEYPSAVIRPKYSVLDTSKIRALGVEVPLWTDALARCICALNNLQ